MMILLGFIMIGLGGGYLLSVLADHTERKLNNDKLFIETLDEETLREIENGDRI